jgi:hypothetical protein
MNDQFTRRLTRIEELMAPPKAVQQSRIVVVFVAPGEDGGPNTVVNEIEFLVDMPTAGGGR